MDAQAPAADHQRSPDRDWWLRTLAIFQSPGTVFTALRDDSREAAESRQEPVLLLLLLAGIAGILVSPTTGTLMNNPERDGILVAVLVFLTALMYGAAVYWIGGGAVYLGIRGAGGKGSFRRARHILAFSAAPLALSLVTVWPVELAVYGTDLFRSGGSDSGVGRWIFGAIEAAFFLWSFGLLVYGVAVVEQWRIVRAVGALGLTFFVVIALALLPFIL